MSLKYELNKSYFDTYFPRFSDFMSSLLSLHSSWYNPTVPGILSHWFLPECCFLPGDSFCSALESCILSTNTSTETQTWAISLLERRAHHFSCCSWGSGGSYSISLTFLVGSQMFAGLGRVTVPQKDICHGCKPSYDTEMLKESPFTFSPIQAY